MQTVQINDKYYEFVPGTCKDCDMSTLDGAGCTLAREVGHDRRNELCRYEDGLCFSRMDGLYLDLIKAKEMDNDNSYN